MKKVIPGRRTRPTRSLDFGRRGKSQNTWIWDKCRITKQWQVSRHCPHYSGYFTNTSTIRNDRAIALKVAEYDLQLTSTPVQVGL